jgi:translocation and assembly module TamA
VIHAVVQALAPGLRRRPQPARRPGPWLRPALAALALLCLLAPWRAHGDTVRVELSGIDGPAADNVLAVLQLARLEDTPLSPVNIRYLHAAAERQIRRALRPFGYYQASVEGVLENPAEGEWLARYTIAPGQPVRIRSVSIKIEGPGAQSQSLMQARNAVHLAPGEVLSHERYENTKTALRSQAHDLGYRDAVYTLARLEVEPDAHAADIRLVLDTGPRFFFGDLVIEQDVLNDELIERFSPFEAGDPFSVSALLDLEYRLFDSGFFSLVEIEPLTADGTTVPVRVGGSPGRRRTWNLRGGFGTDTGPRAGIGYENRRLNRRGDRVIANLELSRPRIELSGQYVQLLKRPASDQRRYQLRVLDQALGDVDSTRFDVSIRESRRDGPWNRVRYLSYLREFDEAGTQDLNAQMLVPGYTIVRSDSDNVTYPTHGSYWQADIRGAIGGVLADTSYVRLTTEGRLIRSPRRKDRIILRSELGAMLVDDFDRVPASERYFAGGARRVRGFGLNSLGPRNDEGQVVGGRFLATASFEYEHRVRGNWAVAAFTDAGNAFNPNDIRIQASAGLGLRWLSPIGMVRLDVARQLTTDDGDLRLHLTFGPEL